MQPLQLGGQGAGGARQDQGGFQDRLPVVEVQILLAQAVWEQTGHDRSLCKVDSVINWN